MEQKYCQSNFDTTNINILTYICFPEKMRRCCCGGMPSFSSTRSLMRSTLSVGSMSISISLPVSVWWVEWKRNSLQNLGDCPLANVSFHHNDWWATKYWSKVEKFSVIKYTHFDFNQHFGNLVINLSRLKNIIEMIIWNQLHWMFAILQL